MQQCLKRFIKTTHVQDWTQEEINQLKVIVKGLAPNSNEDWKKVCLRMHEMGYRKTQTQCKNKGIKFLSNHLRLQIKLSAQNIDELLENFELGNSPKELASMYPSFNISPQKMREILTIKLDSIKNIIKRIVGISKFCSISAKDYNLFSFIRSRNESLPTLIQVAERCRKYKTLERSQKEAEKQEAASIQGFLTDYNSIIKKYYNSFQQYEKIQKKQTHSIKFTDTASRSYCESYQTIPNKSLSNTAEGLNAFLPPSSPIRSLASFSDYEKKSSDIGDHPTLPDFENSPSNSWFTDLFNGKSAMLLCSIEDGLDFDNCIEDCSQLQLGHYVTEIQ